MPSFLLTSSMRPLMGAPGASSASTCIYVIVTAFLRGLPVFQAQSLARSTHKHLHVTLAGHLSSAKVCTLRKQIVILPSRPLHGHDGLEK